MTPEPMEVEAEEEYDDRYCYKERYERYESYESLEERRMQDGREVLSYDAMIGESNCRGFAVWIVDAFSA